MTKNRDDYFEAARIFLDLSEIASAQLIKKIECSFIGAYCYAVQKPVTVYNMSKLPFVGTYRTAKRYCDLMVEAGVLAYTKTGTVIVTKKGNQTSDFFFKALFDMPKLVKQKGLDSNVFDDESRQTIKLIDAQLTPKP
jgi:hypothetical protein